ncbi:MAG: amidophosphoribosyltransferase [Patiriisocius sp.]|jgi:amidophosphoribosyltransferase
MSDSIKHECGVALLRLKKPLSFYAEKYGTPLYGVNKMYLLMEKQHNRGQDAAGIANIKLDTKPGSRYISRKKSIASNPIKDVFDHIRKRLNKAQREYPNQFKDPEWLKANVPFMGELYLGHLRYGTYGKNNLENAHPFLRTSNWKTKSLLLAGNFNMTNVDDLFQILVNIGQYPKEKTDTVTILEKIGHFLDEENQRIFDKHKALGASYREISDHIAAELDVQDILKNSAIDWDGGYLMAGLFGHGDAFVLRDPNGIRPGYFYEDDEVVVVASERPVIQTAFNVPLESVREIPRGKALIIKKSGETSIKEVRAEKEKKSCSFERIYFSRGSDKDIYKERKALGAALVKPIRKAIDGDMENTVFSFIPNTAETSFYGMIKELENQHNNEKIDLIQKGNLSDEELSKLLNQRTRIEKVAIKDAKLRTFITQDSERDELVEHVYDITYGSIVANKDTLVIIDDSIVRGTTLKRSILKMLDRLNPKKIVIVSSAPQIRYPDCYGIDMAKLGEFVAFQAAVSLIQENDMNYLMDEVYEQCEGQMSLPMEGVQNYVQRLYEPFTVEEVSNRIAKLLTPEGVKAEIEVIYQSVEGLHIACPDNLGDWYFTGKYPTPGGNKVVNKAFVNYYKGVNERAY